MYTSIILIFIQYLILEKEYIKRGIIMNKNIFEDLVNKLRNINITEKLWESHDALAHGWIIIITFIFI